MATISYFLTGVIMFMILFGVSMIAWTVSNDENIIRIIIFGGVILVVIIALPLVNLFELFYADTTQVSEDTYNE